MIRNLLDHPVNLLIVVLVIAVLVGWKRLPDVARSVGRSMRIFKSEVEEMKTDSKTRPSAASSDTVKGETVDPAQHTAADTAPDPAPRETHTQPPA
jgi:sec-independent protein translocase protein TatA